MDIASVKKQAFAMPFHQPQLSARALPVHQSRIHDHHLRDGYRGIAERGARKPLQIAEPLVKYEFIRMPDSTGFGNYTESGQVIPVTFDGVAGGYVHSMYLDDDAPIAGGREIWGCPKKLAQPTLAASKDVLLGTLHYGDVRVATGSMGYKHRTLDSTKIKASMETPSFLLKVIPHVDCTPRICELVRYYLEDITIKGAWDGPAALELFHHALAPVALLPVRRVVAGVHVLADLTLGLGEVVHDYLE